MHFEEKKINVCEWKHFIADKISRYHLFFLRELKINISGMQQAENFHE